MILFGDLQRVRAIGKVVFIRVLTMPPAAAWLFFIAFVSP